MFACFAVAGIQIYLLDIKRLSSPNIIIFGEFGASYFLQIRVVGCPKMKTFDVASCFAVAGVQICLLDTKQLSSPNI